MKVFHYQMKRRKADLQLNCFDVVASAGIEPASGASEALILSIVLRGQCWLIVFIKLNQY